MNHDTFNIIQDNDENGRSDIGVEFEYYSNGTLHVMTYRDKPDCKEVIAEIFLDENQYKRFIKFLIDGI